MGPLDEKAMSGPKVLEAFEKFVKTEQELLALIRNAVDRDQQMLAAMGNARSGAN
jgi:hypothetical protein